MDPHHEEVFLPGAYKSVTGKNKKFGQKFKGFGRRDALTITRRSSMDSHHGKKEFVKNITKLLDKISSLSAIFLYK